MSGPNTITGGGFTDWEGNPLANGWLTFTLSSDARTSLSGLVCGGLTFRVRLDPSGNIAGVVSIWPNDQLTPTTTFYRVNAFTSNGAVAWQNTHNFTILSSPNPFVIGTLVPA